MNPVFLFSNAFEYKSERGNYYVVGYLSTPDIDLVNDMITKECLKDMLAQIKQMSINATMKANIDHEHVLKDPRIIPVGKVVNAGLDRKGLWIKVQLNDSLPEFEPVWESIKNNFLDAFSIEYQPIDFEYKVINGREVRVLKKLKLFGLAFTGRPANPEARIKEAFIKSIQGGNMEVKKKVSNFEEIRKKMKMSVEEFYAIPRDPPSASKLPIFDAAHVRNAIARFNQVEGVTPEEKKKAWAKILKAAKKFKIEVSKAEKKEEPVKKEVKEEPKEEEKSEPDTNPKQIQSKSETKEKVETEVGAEETKEPEKEEVKEVKEKEETKVDEIKSLQEKVKSLEKQLEEIKARTDDNKLLENVKSIVLDEINNLEPEKKPLVKKEVKFVDKKEELKSLSKGEVAQRILFKR